MLFFRSMFLILLLHAQSICALVSYPQAYFSPVDNIQKRLITFIDAEQERIHAAIYYLTDKSIVQALGKAKQRGVDVVLILDQSSVDAEWNKIAELEKWEIPFYIYNGGESAIMHNKFFIFGRSTLGSHLVWTGSFNPTRKASQKNFENVVIIEDVALAQRYEQEFERIKKASTFQAKKNGHLHDAHSFQPLLRLTH